MKANHDFKKINLRVVLAIGLGLIALASFASAQPRPNRNLEKFNTIRIARLPGGTHYLATDQLLSKVMDTALQRYRASGYLYVMAAVDIIDTSDPARDSDAELEGYLRAVIRAASGYGLRVIPQIIIGSNHATSWEKMSSSIQMNRQICNRC